ncbi:MAG TPA: HDOD domain-containing protein [Polyangia bacterium]
MNATRTEAPPPPRATGNHGRVTVAVSIAQTIAVRIDHLAERIITDPKALRRTLPDVAAEVIELCSRSNASAESMEHTLTRDPFISAQVVSVANSAMFAPRMPILSVRDAVVRIGLDAVRDVVLMVVANSTMFRIPGLNAEIDSMRKRMLASASMARLLARAVGAQSEYGFLAGLLHDIGTLVLLERAVHEGIVTPAIWSADVEGELVRERIHAHHTAAGAAICRSWKLPSGVVDAAQFHHDYRSGGKTHLAAHLVAAADVGAEYILPDSEPPALKASERPELAELGLDPAAIENLIERARPAALALINAR